MGEGGYWGPSGSQTRSKKLKGADDMFTDADKDI